MTFRMFIYQCVYILGTPVDVLDHFLIWISPFNLIGAPGIELRCQACNSWMFFFSALHIWAMAYTLMCSNNPNKKTTIYSWAWHCKPPFSALVKQMVGDAQEFKASWDHIMNSKLTCAAYEEFVLKQTTTIIKPKTNRPPNNSQMPKPAYQPKQTKQIAQHNPWFSHATVSHLGHFLLEAIGALLLQMSL